jgi:hypothetical protein
LQDIRKTLRAAVSEYRDSRVLALPPQFVKKYKKGGYSKHPSDEGAIKCVMQLIRRFHQSTESLSLDFAACLVDVVELVSLSLSVCPNFDS